MTMDEEKLKITGWIAIGLLALGQLLPWTYRGRPFGQVWDFLFSSISKPNPEWWIWFLAPVIAITLGAMELTRRRRVPPSVFFPAIAFFLTWAALFLTGVRRYTGFRRPGFLVTFIGFLVLGLVAALGTRTKPVAARPTTRR